MLVCCECCVLLCRGLCDELIALPEDSYRVWFAAVCDVETSRMRRPRAAAPQKVKKKKKSCSLAYKYGRFGRSVASIFRMKEMLEMEVIGPVETPVLVH